MSKPLDLIIRSGRVVTPAGLVRTDVGVVDGKIVAISPQIAESAAEEIDASFRVVFPGIVDAHVHFNEPGRTDWEGLESGSASLAAGGGTVFFDMPLNSLPPSIDAAAFNLKRRLAEQKSKVDFGLWGGLVPGNTDKFAELKEAGAVGLKAFMCGSGVDEFPGVTDAATLRKGMVHAAELGLMVAVHAEDEALAGRLVREARARGEMDRTSWLATRPVAVELEAIKTAIGCAGETGCALHIVHVSSPEGLSLVARAKKDGLDVTAETCPHYLLLNDGAVVEQGAPAKCFPPLRPEGLRQEMWHRLELGEIDTIGSDHSPAPPQLKLASDFFDIWGGISGCQHGFILTLSEGIYRWGTDLAFQRMSPFLADNVAKRFKIPGKGRIEVGYDADFALLEIGEPVPVHNSDLLYKHMQGPYDGRTSRVRIDRTIVRGRSVFADRHIATGPARGHFLKPNS